MRRRWTLAPPPWSADGAGSRFACLGELDAAPSGVPDLSGAAAESPEEILGAEVAFQVGMEALDGGGFRPPSPMIRRPVRSEAELRQEFWTAAGYPTPESRFWERSSVSPPGDQGCGPPSSKQDGVPSSSSGRRGSSSPRIGVRRG